MAAQGMSAAHGFVGGADGLGTKVQVKPFPQSAAVLQSWARAGPAVATSAASVSGPTRRTFVGDMSSLRAGVGSRSRRGAGAPGGVPTPCQVSAVGSRGLRAKSNQFP